MLNLLRRQTINPSPVLSKALETATRKFADYNFMCQVCLLAAEYQFKHGSTDRANVFVESVLKVDGFQGICFV